MKKTLPEVAESIVKIREKYNEIFWKYTYEVKLEEQFA